MRNMTGIATALVIALLLAMGSVFIVNESQTAIVLNLGKIVRTNLQPGLHFKLPMVEEVRKFDRRILTLDDAPERYLTAEKKDVEVDFFVKWRISNVTTFYRAASGGDEIVAQVQAPSNGDRHPRAERERLFFEAMMRVLDREMLGYAD